jgi:predicted phosphodiesterase
MARKKNGNVSSNGNGEIDWEKLTSQELIQVMQERGYTITKHGLKTEQTFRVPLTRWHKTSWRFALVSDTHLCSKHQQLTHLWTFYRLLKKRRIGVVLHAGDVYEGEKVYRGQEYELFRHGADAQLQYGVENYPRVSGITTYVISGNHDQSFQKTAGIDIVDHLADQRDDIVYLGADLGFVKPLDEEASIINIGVMHGSGGVAYARSYKLQKIVEALAPENKPNFMALGHYHTPCILPGYRNVEAIQMPCFQAQTPYLKKKGLFPFVAGVIVTLKVDDKGLSSITYEFTPFYEVINEDY